jgi:hypothetical protein
MSSAKSRRFSKVCFPVSAVGLMPGDIVVIPDLERDELNELKLVLSISRGHTAVTVQFLHFFPPRGGIKEETCLPHEQWSVLIPQDDENANDD